MDNENYFLHLTSSYHLVIAVTAVILICLNVQMALFCALGVSYTGKNLMLFFSFFFSRFSSCVMREILPSHSVIFLILSVMIMHAAFRKLTPARQPTRSR